MVRVWPEASAPRLQGNGVVHAPVFETNVRPGGVGSSTVTSCAAAGPAFVTVSRYEIVSPGRASASPVLRDRQVRGRRDHGRRHGRGVVAGIESLVVVATVAVLMMVRSRRSRRDRERRLDGPGLAGGNGAERTGKRRRAVAGVPHERQAGRRRIGHRDASGVAGPVVASRGSRRSRSRPPSRSPGPAS